MKIVSLFSGAGYKLSFKLLNASDYGIAQDRKRVFFIGIRNDLNLEFTFPEKTTPNNKNTLANIILDLQGKELPAKEKNKTKGDLCSIINHEYMIGGFSTMYMSRNRVRSWDEQSFTIQAGGRHAPLHPQAPKMDFISQDVREFVKGKESLYRRLTVRECARIQTFPDDFLFHYENIADGYKMVGNAVPVKLAEIIALEIKKLLNGENQKEKENKRLFENVY